VKDIEKLLHQVGVLPESPIGRLVIALSERIDRLEREVLPQDPPPEFFE
jgi:hypothetical protein